MVRGLTVLVLICSAFMLKAGDLICGPQLFEYLPSDGQVRSQSWVNSTGNTVYVVRVSVYVYGANYSPGGTVFGAVSRNSDYNLLTYWSWVLNDDTEPHGPQGSEVSENFRPDYITIAPGDGLTIQSYSAGFGGPAYRSFVSGYFWYSFNP